MYFKNNQNVGILLLFIVSHVVVKMAVSFAANNESRVTDTMEKGQKVFHFWMLLNLPSRIVM